MFMCSAITPPKLNWFGWNQEHSEYIVGGWPWQILGAIHAVVTVWEAAKMSFFCFLNNSRFPIGQILRHLNTTSSTTSIRVAMRTFGTELWNVYRKGSFFKKAKVFHKMSTSWLATSGRHNYTIITDFRKFTNKWSLYGMFSFHFYR